MKQPTHPSPSCRARVPLLLLPTLLALTAAGTGTAAWAGPKNVPFTASVVTQETPPHGDPVACNAYPYLANNTTGSGVASHMGRISFAAGDCITPMPPTYSFGNGHLTITAANGDQLKATYQGTLTPLPNPLQLPLFTAYGDFTVTGGTGRFQDATGSGFLQGVENLQTGQGYFDLTGRISY